MEFQEKNSFFGHFWSKKHFFDFFQKTPFSTFLFFFFNSKDGTHVLIEILIKLNADSEFLVHFYVGPHFGVFWPCLLWSIIGIPMTCNTNDFFLKKYISLHIVVCVQIKALFMSFHLKKKLDPPIHISWVHEHLKNWAYIRTKVTFTPGCLYNDFFLNQWKFFFGEHKQSAF